MQVDGQFWELFDHVLPIKLGEKKCLEEGPIC